MSVLCHDWFHDGKQMLPSQSIVTGGGTSSGGRVANISISIRFVYRCGM
jgi:hypothetical protein